MKQKWSILSILLVLVLVMVMVPGATAISQPSGLKIYQAANNSPVLVIFYSTEKDEPVPHPSLVANGVTVVTAEINEDSGVDNSAVKQALAVLDWISENIIDYNGNPENVTIAGEGKDAQLAIALLRVNYKDNVYTYSDPVGDGAFYVNAWTVDTSKATTDRERKFHNIVLWSPLVSYLTIGSISGNNPATYYSPYLADYSESQLASYKEFYGEDSYLFKLEGDLITDGATGSVLTNRDLAITGVNIMTNGVSMESAYEAPADTTWENLSAKLTDDFDIANNNWQTTRFPQAAGLSGQFTKANLISHFINNHPNKDGEAETAKAAYKEFFSNVALANYVGAANLSNQPVDDARDGFYMNPDHQSFVSYFYGDNAAAMEHWLGYNDSLLGNAMRAYLATFVKEGFMGWYDDSLDYALLNGTSDLGKLPYWGRSFFWESDMHMRLDPGALNITKAASRQVETAAGLLPFNMALAARANNNYRTLARIYSDGTTVPNNIAYKNESRTHGLTPNSNYTFNATSGLLLRSAAVLSESVIQTHKDNGWIGDTITAADVDAPLPDTAFMHYYLWVPPEAKDNPEKEYPLITYFHGAGGGQTNLWQTAGFVSATSWTGAGFQAEFDTGAAYILIPYSPETAGGFSNSWNVFSNWQNKDNSPGNTLYEPMVRKMYDNILNEFNIDPFRIIISGHSAGGFMTARTAASRPDFYAGAFVNSAAYIYNWFDMTKLKDTNVWWVHGAADNVVPVQRMQGMLDKYSYAPENVSASNPYGLTAKNEWEFYNLAGWPSAIPANRPIDVANILGSITNRSSLVTGMGHADTQYKTNNMLSGSGIGAAPVTVNHGNYFTFTEWANSVRCVCYGYQIVFDVNGGVFSVGDLEEHVTQNNSGSVDIRTDTRLKSIATADRDNFAAYAIEKNGFKLPIGSAPNNPAKEGFVFAGWYDDSGNEFSINTVFSKNTSFIAKWYDESSLRSYTGLLNNASTFETLEEARVSAPVYVKTIEGKSQTANWISHPVLDDYPEGTAFIYRSANMFGGRTSWRNNTNFIVFIDQHFNNKIDAYAWLVTTGLIEIIEETKGSIIILTPSDPSAGFTDVDAKNYYAIETAQCSVGVSMQVNGINSMIADGDYYGGFSYRFAYAINGGATYYNDYIATNEEYMGRFAGVALINGGMDVGSEVANLMPAYINGVSKDIITCYVNANKAEISAKYGYDEYYVSSTNEAAQVIVDNNTSKQLSAKCYSAYYDLFRNIQRQPVGNYLLNLDKPYNSYVGDQSPYSLSKRTWFVGATPSTEDAEGITDGGIIMKGYYHQSQFADNPDTNGQFIGTWFEYLPVEINDAADGTIPLVLLLHGNDDDMRVVAHQVGWVDLAEQKRFAIVAPDHQLLAGNKPKADNFAALVEYICEKYPQLDRSRVYITGFSLGGMASSNAILYRPEVFAAAAPMAGLTVPAVLTPEMKEIADMYDIPVIFYMSTSDTYVCVDGDFYDGYRRSTIANGIDGLRAINEMPPIEYDSTINRPWGFYGDTSYRFIVNDEYPGGSEIMYNDAGVPMFAVTYSSFIRHALWKPQAELVWDFLEQFSRDQDTKEIIYSPKETEIGELGGLVIIDGLHQVGKTLTVDITGLTTTSLVTPLGDLSFAWIDENGNELGTDAIYLIQTADIGKIINVSVTAENCKGVVTSDNTFAVAPAALVNVTTSTNDYISIAETAKNSREWTLSFWVTETYEGGDSKRIEYSITINSNNANVDGSYDLGNGYILIYDIKGNGSNIKEFRIISG